MKLKEIELKTLAVLMEAKRLENEGKRPMKASERKQLNYLCNKYPSESFLTFNIIDGFLQVIKIEIGDIVTIKRDIKAGTYFVRDMHTGYFWRNKTLILLEQPVKKHHLILGEKYYIQTKEVI